MLLRDDRNTSLPRQLLLEIIEKYDTQVYGVSTSREGGFGLGGDLSQLQLTSTGELRSSLSSGERSRGGQMDGVNWNGNEAALTAINSWTQGQGQGEGGERGDAGLPARPGTACKQRARDRLGLGVFGLLFIYYYLFSVPEIGSD